VISGRHAHEHIFPFCIASFPMLTRRSGGSDDTPRSERQMNTWRYLIII
jgi:hypothetical protein